MNANHRHDLIAKALPLSGSGAAAQPVLAEMIALVEETTHLLRSAWSWPKSLPVAPVLAFLPVLFDTIPFYRVRYRKNITLLGMYGKYIPSASCSQVSYFHALNKDLLIQWRKPRHASTAA
jgi:hypothetical protein